MILHQTLALIEGSDSVIKFGDASRRLSEVTFHAELEEFGDDYESDDDDFQDGWGGDEEDADDEEYYAWMVKRVVNQFARPDTAIDLKSIVDGNVDVITEIANVALCQQKGGELALVKLDDFERRIVEETTHVLDSRIQTLDLRVPYVSVLPQTLPETQETKYTLLGKDVKCWSNVDLVEGLIRGEEEKMSFADFKGAFEAQSPNLRWAALHGLPHGLVVNGKTYETEEIHKAVRRDALFSYSCSGGDGKCKIPEFVSRRETYERKVKSWRGDDGWRQSSYCAADVLDTCVALGYSVHEWKFFFPCVKCHVGMSVPVEPGGRFCAPLGFGFILLNVGTKSVRQYMLIETGLSCDVCKDNHDYPGFQQSGVPACMYYRLHALKKRSNPVFLSGDACPYDDPFYHLVEKVMHTEAVVKVRNGYQSALRFVARQRARRDRHRFIFDAMAVSRPPQDVHEE